MARVACFTSFNRAYLSRARTLYQTLKALHPEVEFFALYVDEHVDPQVGAALQGYFDHLVLARDIGIENFHAWVFSHDVIEACTGVKGQFCKTLNGMGFDKVVYLDPDIAVLGSLAPILAAMDQHAIQLTPHQLEPDSLLPRIIDNEVCSLRTGTYNLGFFAVNMGRPDGLRFAEWWSARLQYLCRDDSKSGLFTDQKWCDLVPAFFADYKIIRDPGCNVASWNLSQRAIAISREGIFVNGEPLRFFHFSKVGSVGRVMIEKNAKTALPAIELALWYDRCLAQNACDEAQGEWRYGCFDDGEPISKEARHLYRDRRDLQAAFPQPFSAGHNSYQVWYRMNEANAD